MKLSASDKLALIREYKAQGGKGSYLDVIREYQNGGWTNKYIPNTDKFLQPTSEKLPSGFVIPFNTPSTELAISIGGVNGEPAYLIPSFKYGESLKNPMEEYRKTGEYLGGPFKTWQEADEWDRTVRHPYVEKGKDIPYPIRTWGSSP